MPTPSKDTLAVPFAAMVFGLSFLAFDEVGEDSSLGLLTVQNLAFRHGVTNPNKGSQSPVWAEYLIGLVFLI
jgi:hypothetical protein